MENHNFPVWNIIIFQCSYVFFVKSPVNEDQWMSRREIPLQACRARSGLPIGDIHTPSKRWQDLVPSLLLNKVTPQPSTNSRNASGAEFYPGTFLNMPCMGWQGILHIGHRTQNQKNMYCTIVWCMNPINPMTQHTHTHIHIYIYIQNINIYTYILINIFIYTYTYLNTSIHEYNIYIYIDGYKHVDM